MSEGRIRLGHRRRREAGKEEDGSEGRVLDGRADAEDEIMVGPAAAEGGKEGDETHEEVIEVEHLQHTQYNMHTPQ